MLADRFQSSLSGHTDVLSEFKLMKHTVYNDPKLVQEPAHKIMEIIAGPMSQTLPNLAKLASVGLLIPASTAGRYSVYVNSSKVSLSNKQNAAWVNWS